MNKLWTLIAINKLILNEKIVYEWLMYIAI